MALIPRTDLDVFGLNLGCNVFGWTASREESFAVLDAYAAAGGNFLDTADAYMAGVPGNSGGESETIIGEWLAARGRPDGFAIKPSPGSTPNPRSFPRSPAPAPSTSSPAAEFRPASTRRRRARPTHHDLAVPPPVPRTGSRG